jgi:hypothetical protein
LGVHVYLEEWRQLAEARERNSRRRRDHAQTSAAWVEVNREDSRLHGEIVAVAEFIEATYGVDAGQ